MVNKTKFLEEEDLGYRIIIAGRNVLITESMKSYAYDKFSKIDKFHNHVLDLHVILDIERLEHSCSAVLVFKQFKIKVSSKSTDMYASIDKTVDKLQAQLRRWKGKIQDYHNKPLSSIDMTVNVLRKPYNELEEINAEIENANRKLMLEEYQPPKIIGNEKTLLKTLTTDEAVMKMELSGDQFMLFRCEEDQKLKLIYRRNDGNYGLILPE